MKRKLLTILLATAACGALIGAVGCTGESSSGGGGGGMVYRDGLPARTN